jgi:hypothetical protein
MANAYSAPNFDIDTNIDEAGLATLKGSPVATTDLIYVYGGAKVTLGVAGNFACLDIYLGDNSAGTAVTKTGYCDILNKAGFTVTLHTATINGGLSGEGSTSKYTIIGTTGNNVTIKSNTTYKASDLNVRGCANEYQYVTFLQMVAVTIGSANAIVNNVTVNCNAGASNGGFYFYNSVMPAVFTGNTVSNISTSGLLLLESDALTDAQVESLTKEIAVIGTSAINCSYKFFRKNGTKYITFRRNDAPYGVAPTWTTTTGIQTLADNAATVSGSLTATWGAATSARGENVRYNVYIRPSAAPDSFGLASVYFYGSTKNTSAIIASAADGSALVYGTTYHVIVRAADNENEDTNTTALTAIPTNILSAVDINQRNLFALIASEQN